MDIRHNSTSLRNFSLSIFLLLALVSTAAFADEQDSVQWKKRPTVGLVLSGGGAKGFAYIGMLKVMRDAGLRVDYIGGSSMGSIIGGLYALGYDPDSIEKIVRMQNWDNLLSDEIERKYVAYEDKEFGEKTIISLPIRNKTIDISSMYQGQQINLLLNHYFSPAFKISDFHDLQTPFLCIGTDLITGDEVILNKGYLPMAIRASMSIPGYFTPTLYDGKYLVDGGVVNNYPVKEVKDMGAQIIVGGDVQSGLYKTIDKLSSLTAILDQITSFYRVKANQIGDSLTNLYIPIKMEYGLMDFDAYDSIMALGERVARSHFTEIKKLADSLNAIEYRPVKFCNTQPIDSVYIDSVVICGNTKTSSKYIVNRLQIPPHSWVPLKFLEKKITVMYGSGDFQHVFYRIEQNGIQTNLVIEVKEDEPGYLSAGIHFDNNYNGSLLLEGFFSDLLGKQTKLFANIVLGINPRLKALYLADFGRNYGFGAIIDMYYFKFNLYDHTSKINSISFTNYKASVFFNSTVKNVFNFRSGFEYEYFQFKQTMSVDSVYNPYQRFSSYGTLFASLHADTRDRALFPTKGFNSALRIEYVMPLSKDFSDNVFSNSPIIFLQYDQSIPLSCKFVLRPGLFGGALLYKQSSPPPQHLFGLGGLNPINYVESFVPFAGVKFEQKLGYYTAVGRLQLQYNVFKKMYLTARTDIGANEDTFGDVFKPENFLCGYGLTYSYNSFIGPLELTVMGSNINPKPMLFLNIGYWF
jgi:NTE family protein